jgi:hypothetical protein
MAMKISWMVGRCLAPCCLENADDDGADESQGNTDRRDVQLGRPVKSRRQIHDNPLYEWRGTLANHNACGKACRQAESIRSLDELVNDWLTPCGIEKKFPYLLKNIFKVLFASVLPREPRVDPLQFLDRDGVDGIFTQFH